VLETDGKNAGIGTTESPMMDRVCRGHLADMLQAMP
jgi:hypothetical protein